MQGRHENGMESVDADEMPALQPACGGERPAGSRRSFEPESSREQLHPTRDVLLCSLENDTHVQEQGEIQ